MRKSQRRDSALLIPDWWCCRFFVGVDKDDDDEDQDSLRIQFQIPFVSFETETPGPPLSNLLALLPPAAAGIHVSSDWRDKIEISPRVASLKRLYASRAHFRAVV